MISDFKIISYEESELSGSFCDPILEDGHVMLYFKETSGRLWIERDGAWTRVLGPTGADADRDR